MSRDCYKVRYQGAAARLDRVLLSIAEQGGPLASATRSQLKKLIEAGAIVVNKKSVDKAGALVKSESELEIDLRPLQSADLEPADIALPLLFEDEDIIVVDKPAGISMHPGAGERLRTVANALLHKISKAENFPEKGRPGIVHRIDKDTSGVVVVAKNAMAHANLAAQFARHSTGRVYWALVFCTPRARREVNLADEGTVDQPLGRHPTQKTKMAVVAEGRRAVTHWKVVKHYSYARLLEVRLETGRTHQIRVHMAHLRCPLIGDQQYGLFTGLPNDLARAAAQFGRQALHARELAFDHPRTGARLKFASEIPKDFSLLLRAFERHG